MSKLVANTQLPCPDKHCRQREFFYSLCCRSLLPPVELPHHVSASCCCTWHLSSSPHSMVFRTVRYRTVRLRDCPHRHRCGHAGITTAPDQRPGGGGQGHCWRAGAAGIGCRRGASSRSPLRSHGRVPPAPLQVELHIFVATSILRPLPKQTCENAALELYVDRHAFSTNVIVHRRRIPSHS